MRRGRHRARAGVELLQHEQAADRERCPDDDDDDDNKDDNNDDDDDDDEQPLNCSKQAVDTERCPDDHGDNAGDDDDDNDGDDYLLKTSSRQKERCTIVIIVLLVNIIIKIITAIRMQDVVPPRRGW